MGERLSLLELKAARDRARAGIGRPVQPVGALAGDGNGNVYIPSFDRIWFRFDGGQGPDGIAWTARTDLTDGMPITVDPVADRSPQDWVVRGRTRRVTTVLYTYEVVGSDINVLQVTPAGVATNLGTRPFAATRMDAHGGTLVYANGLLAATADRVHFYAGGSWSAPALPARRSSDRVGVAFYGGVPHILTVASGGTDWELRAWDGAAFSLISTLGGVDSDYQLLYCLSPDPAGTVLFAVYFDFNEPTNWNKIKRYRDGVWSDIALPAQSFATDAMVDNGYIYLATGGDPVYFSADGASWSTLMSNIPSISVAAAVLHDTPQVYWCQTQATGAAGGGIVHYGGSSSGQVSRLRATNGSGAGAGSAVLVSTDGASEIGGVVQIGGTIYFVMDDDTSSGTGSPPNGVHVWTGGGFTTLYAAAGPTHMLAKGEAVV